MPELAEGLVVREAPVLSGTLELVIGFVLVTFVNVALVVFTGGAVPKLGAVESKGTPVLSGTLALITGAVLGIFVLGAPVVVSGGGLPELAPVLSG